MMQSVPFACDMSAFSPEERSEHIASIHAVFGRVRTFRELTDGFEFAFERAPQDVAELAEFVANEQRCCPFFTFTVRLEPAPGPLVLQLTGPAGVKPFILAELGAALPTSLPG